MAKMSPVSDFLKSNNYDQSVQMNNSVHRRRKYGGSSPNSLRPISYFGSIWELYVLDLKTNIVCRKKIQLQFPMNKGLNSANGLAGNNQNATQNFSPICLPKPKT